MSAADIPAAVRSIIVERDPVCRRCARRPGEHIHHRKGRRIRDPHRLSNLVRLCASCHAWVHAHPLDGYAEGFLIESAGGVEPVDVPVSVWPYGPTLLLDCGCFLFPPELRPQLAPHGVCLHPHGARLLIAPDAHTL